MTTGSRTLRFLRTESGRLATGQTRVENAVAEMDVHQEYFESLSPEAKQLVVLQSILYEGSWGEMVLDLTARRDGKPFIWKLKSRIEEDLDRIERLREYERAHDVRLNRYVPPHEQGA